MTDRCPTCDRDGCEWHASDKSDLGSLAALGCNVRRVNWRQRAIDAEARLEFFASDLREAVRLGYRLWTWTMTGRPDVEKMRDEWQAFAAKADHAERLIKEKNDE